MEIIDTDEQIEKSVGLTISEIFEQKGEAFFREQEHICLKNLNRLTDTVISCGGGMALNPDNVTEMKRLGRIVLLVATPETIFERVKRDTCRPLLKDRIHLEYITNLLEERKSRYERAADWIVATDNRKVADIGKEIWRKAMIDV